MTSSPIDINSPAAWLRYVRAHLGQPGAEPFVFVSAASKDLATVDRAVSVLDHTIRYLTCPVTGRRYTVEHFAHPVTGSRQGDLFPQDIARWMWNCRAAVLIWSQNFLDHPWCRDIEAPSLVWRWQKHELPLFVLRLDQTSERSNVVSVEDADGTTIRLDLDTLNHDRHPKVNRGVSPAQQSAWLPDLSATNFSARLVAVFDEIAREIEKRWHVVSTPPAAVIAPPEAGPGPPPPSFAPPLQVKWAGDFSSQDGGPMTGREADLHRLTDHARDSGVAVLAMTALGGQGKTTLVRAWIERDVRAGHIRAFEGVFAFSFYHDHPQEQFAGELSAFLDPTAPKSDPHASPQGRLIEMLRGRRILLFLDGVEAIQNEDVGRDAARMARGPVLDLLFGLCAQEVAESLAVITSRLRLLGFEDYDGTRLVDIDLGGLTQEAGSRLLLDLGVTNSSNAKREGYCRDLAGHPLALRMYADAVRRRAQTLDFGNAAEKVAEAMDLAAPIELRDKLSRVVASYRGQFTARERAIIEAVAVFGGTATIEGIRAYIRQRNGAPSGAGEVAIQGQIEALVAAGILQFRDDRGAHRYSCHPILRKAFMPDAAGARSAVAISLYSRPAPLRPRTLKDAESYLLAIRIHTEAGAFNDAAEMLKRYLGFGDILEGFVGGQRALLDCLMAFLHPDRRKACEARLGRTWLVAVVRRIVGASIDLGEWELADELLANEPYVAKAPNVLWRARLAAEIGAAADARQFYAEAIKAENPRARGPIILELAELERHLGAPHHALRRIREWAAMDQPVEEWLAGWPQALETVGRIVSRSHPGLAERCIRARSALLKGLSADDEDDGHYAEYALLDLKPREARTQDDWQRLLALGELMEKRAEASRAKALLSWPILRVTALNRLGRAPEAEQLAGRSIHQLHQRSWRRLWFRTEIVRSRLQQGHVDAGLWDARKLLEVAGMRQRSLIARDAAEIIVQFGTVEDDRTRDARRLLDTLNEQFRPAGDDIPDLGPLPGQDGWDERVTQRLLREVRPEQRDAPVSRAELDVALVRAAELGLTNAVPELLRLGASARAASKRRGSALEAAVKRGHRQIVETLLEASSQPLDLTDERDLAAFAAAIAGDEAGILARLLATCVGKNPDLLAHLLAAAATAGSGGTIRVLCDAGAEPSRLADDQHPLVRAARAGNLSAVEALVERVRDINDAVDADGATALMAAMAAGHEPIIVWLLNRGANVNARDGSGRTAVDYALQQGQGGALDLLVTVTGHDGLMNVEPATLAVNASLNGAVEELQRAIARGARIGDPDRLGRLPIVAAAGRGHLDVIRAIRRLVPDLDIDAADRTGQTALMAAAGAGHAPIVTALVMEFGAQLDPRDRMDRDAITYALAGNSPDTIRALTSLGARPRDVDATIAGIRAASADGHRDALLAFLRAVTEAGWMNRLSERVAL